MSGANGQNAGDSAVRLGLICGVFAYGLWGMLPIYLKALGGVDPIEIVGHRILWSVPFGALILTLRKQWRETFRAFASSRVVLLLGFSAAVIAANWLLYVWAVAHERVLQASLGYYINPLMFVAAGVIVLKEKLNRAQRIAVALAAVGVSVLTFGAGVFPWVSLLLAISFTTYGYVRKMLDVGGMPGLFIETALLSPFALLFLVWFSKTSGLAFGQGDIGMDVLLILAGPVTVVPLVLFALAARRLRFSTLGFLQYIGPTGQFILGLYYGEEFTAYHAVCFGLIWTALAVFSLDAVRENRKLRRAAAATPPASAYPKSS
ncbi:EamA family transporter RarD [Hyphococcus luteus]|uniref:EamA family transporter RarD n=1 Tax=Hyphococcus luteus TaxID=2058213 RepID=A0A2S7K7V7_9PROT|nr:EamA family transporter RarD [Marinicaulis flavus]PQA88576.1 EamA family transporter RarD [Marinicaulis flavus]